MHLTDWLGTSLVLAGLLLVVVLVVAALSRPASVLWLHADPVGRRSGSWARRLTSVPARFEWSLGLIAAGFLVGVRNNVLWWMVVVVAVTGVTVASLSLLQYVHRKRRMPRVDGPVLALVLVTATLLEFGLLLVVRLVVVADPAAEVRTSASSAAFSDARDAVLQPLAGIALVLVTIALVASGRLTLPYPRLAGMRWPLAGALVFSAAPFWLPLLPGGSNNRLRFLGFATPEYGRVIYVIVLALVVAESSFALRGRLRPAETLPLSPRAAARSWRFLLIPLGLFAVATLGNVLRHDFGAVIPLAAATIGVTWAAARAEAGDQQTRVLAYYRPFAVFWIGIAVLVLIAGQFTSYASDRRQVWEDPWAYRWNESACMTAPDLPAPNGAVACVIDGAAESDAAQISHGLAATADGGLLGRGLASVLDPPVPAGPTDLVIPLIWSKLGAVAVLLLVALVLLLSLSLRALGQRAGSSRRRRGPPSAGLFAAGLGTMITGQFMFVLLATLGIIPHSGLTAPFLSRGGQSTLALTVGVMIAVVWAYRGSTPGARARQASSVPGSLPVPARSGGALVALATAVCAAMLVTVFPYLAPGRLTAYSEQRQYCWDDTPPPACSTDGYAYRRGAVELSVSGRPEFRFDRSQRRWLPTDDQKCRPDRLSIGDMSGLLSIAGGDAGVVDRAYRDLVNTPAAGSLGDRLSPFGGHAPAATLDLTLEPTLQHLAATALTSPGPGNGAPLAGTVILLDSTNGDVLAAASAPGAASGCEKRNPTGADVTLTGWGIRDSKGKITPIPGDDPRCDARHVSAEQLHNCVRIGYHRPDTTTTVDPDLLRYTGADRRFQAPKTERHRGLTERYGPGSAFKVVVAAAAIKAGYDENSTISGAPLTVEGKPLNNFGDGSTCEGSDLISLTRALAVSCNTAFARWAQKLGWPAIEEMATAFGFDVVAGADGEEQVLTSGGPASADKIAPGRSSVPSDPTGRALALSAIGEGTVTATPLQMARVLATVANHGRLVTPRLVRADDVGPRARFPLTPAQAATLERALSQTTSPDGTAALLRLSDGLRAWVKTGTHEVHPCDQPAAKDEYSDETSWMVGYVKTGRGPVAFAIAVEARSADADRCSGTSAHPLTSGSARVRWLAEVVLNGVGRLRR